MTNSESESSENSDFLSLTSSKQGRFYSFVGIAPKRRNMQHMQRGRGRHRRRGMQKFGSKIRQRMIMARLLDLGLTRGCKFQVIQISIDGPILLQIRGTRIAIGHRLASNVLVKEVTP